MAKVVDGGGRRSLLEGFAEQAFERLSELAREDAVYEWVDARIQVDSHPTKQHQPFALVSMSGKGVVENVGAIGQPQSPECNHYTSQHFSCLHVIDPIVTYDVEDILKFFNFVMRNFYLIWLNFSND